MAERIGIFGGTFDPVHLGHLVAAVNARHALALDVVLMVVAHDPWQKADRTVTPAADRLAMLQAAVEGVDGVEASAMEMERGGTTYTIDTVEQLRRGHPGAGLVLVVGSDVAADLDSWERSTDLRRLVELAVVSRPGRPAVVPEGWEGGTVSIPALDISATDLRARVAAGAPLDFLVPDGAIRWIRSRGLYAGG